MSLKPLSVLAAISMTTLLSASLLHGVTLILQNGLNGYAGFQDTYIENVASPVPHGVDTILQSWCG